MVRSMRLQRSGARRGADRAGKRARYLFLFLFLSQCLCVYLLWVHACVLSVLQ
jgi:hypothetical protein